MRIKNALLSFLLISLSACASSDTVRSDEVSQKVIYQIYNANYDQEEAELSISAAFRVGGPTGTTLELIEPSQVTHESFELRKNQSSINGTSYRTTEESSFVEEHEFTYINNDSEEFVNTLTIPTVAIGDMSVNIPANEDLLLEWEGDSLSEDESMRLEIRDSANFLIVASAFEENATSLTMHKEDLQLLQEGLVTLKLVRTKSSDLQETSEEGGRAHTSYSTRESSANLIK